MCVVAFIIYKWQIGHQNQQIKNLIYKQNQIIHTQQQAL